MTTPTTYSGPERRELDPNVIATPTTSQADGRKTYWVRTGDTEMHVASFAEQHRVITLHNALLYNRTVHAIPGVTDLRETESELEQ